ncbi:hypothetical protein A3G55_01540 [Candidatus Giovannonibacteria bacterium RIFCSPLOWO2_12_FULL_44_25]|uniref:Sulfatase-modifying factor enzyme domain-containing protein n=3 Tax=Parcubacteria group TaxID=1794811 RepID=A0A1F5W947_9BACT|nr:MAG: hypothetical protein A2120_03375 [Candidatus Giovannonibacteria bacterium GWA2_45_15]OGF59794.1 MAG: hypothetical protein A2W40_01660 [Candidatus Giovannonibacteria bacterium RIFCSPHIGHO2_01_45_12]OGF61002.1 MAG: hypothetical protein A2656_01990 [Candidatus Giovannonibacteria bacterium RIFCSPHIGHO2_01_FULL_44_100]OGF72177.1 MAG: hypothetical protein A3C05_03060 [Candidatus Giovannonibacteria bacterium RIFCSPHIGHO2_02_FULL_45_40]OGF84568.1 MAG: hypothetical protein A3A19_00375 [Candidatu
MAKLDVVGCLPSKLLGLQRDMLEKWSGPDGELWVERIALTLQGKNPLEAVVKGPAWADEVVAQARRKLKKFFGRLQVDPVPGVWTPEFLENAAKYNMHPVYFIDLVLAKDWSLKNYTKQESWLYEKIREGKISADAVTLKRRWCLADFSVGVDYTDGSQVFPNDPWAPIIEKLRRDLRVIGKYDNTPCGSRFAITPKEWDDVVLAYMASALRVTRAQTCLERAGEFNFIGNVYDPNRGRFNMWEWFRDPFGGSDRLYGGYRRYGGLAGVGCVSSDDRYDGIAGRPLVSF